MRKACDQILLTPYGEKFVEQRLHLRIAQTDGDLHFLGPLRARQVCNLSTCLQFATQDGNVDEYVFGPTEKCFNRSDP